MKLSENKSVKRRDCDFKALELKLNEDSVSSHTIYIKEHSVREHTEDKPSGKTLFIVNVPPLADENGIRNAFSGAGAIESVQFCNKPNAKNDKTPKKFIEDNSETLSFRFAYVVFKKVLHLDKALKLTRLQPMNSSEHQIRSGMKRWTDEYNSNILQTKAIKEKVEEFMREHDNEIRKAEAKEKELEKEDDEGWVTVTKKGNVQSFARTEKVENKILAKEEKNKKRKELKNFYTFQIRESKMKHIIALRQKFEEDKKKIAQIKQSRRFRPF